MNYEERYKQAIEAAKKELHCCGSLDCDAVRQIFRLFPELRESENEKIRKAIIRGMNALKAQKAETFAAIPIDDCLAWLEKQGEQKPAEWSEEDEEMFDAIIADIQFTQKAHNHEVNQVVYEREIDWLKSLKHQNRWKPSKEQINALDKAKNSPANHYDTRLELQSLYNDLKNI